MLSNMACSLIEHKRITTTVAKAKSLRKFVEPLITKSKTDSTHSRRVVFSTLKSKDHVAELFREVAPKVATREGGYTRIIKLGTRQGDAAEMCMIELVDFNTIMLEDSSSKTRRSRRGGKKKSTETSTTSAAQTAEKKDAKADASDKEPKQELKAEEAAREAKEKEVRAQELASEEKAIEAKEKIPAKDPKSEGKTPDTDSKG